LNIKIFKFLNENTIFLAGSKNLHDFYNKSGNSAVLFVSKDKGKTFQEIIFPEENVIKIELSEKYSLIETNSGGYSSMGKNVVFILNNATLQYQKVDAFSSNDDVYYGEFTGKYVVYSKGKIDKFINIFTKEEYLMPFFLKDKFYVIENEVSIIYLNKKEILRYNVITKKNEIIKKLNDNYDYMYYEDGYFELGKLNLFKTQATVHNLNEEQIYVSSEKTEKKLYRYKNFACQFMETRPYITFRYSYDYGKTWHEYKTDKVFTTVTPKGYYKDKYMLLDVCFYDKKDNTNIMVGEFEK